MKLAILLNLPLSFLTSSRLLLLLRTYYTSADLGKYVHPTVLVIYIISLPSHR